MLRPATPSSSDPLVPAAVREPLARLKAQPRRPHEASFFWYDAHFKSLAVKILPGEFYVAKDASPLIVTTLGSCIAACLWDAGAGIGGMNHFMLPEGGTGDGGSGRFGAFAMELLINEMQKMGARRSSLQAKVFGGGQVIAGMDSMNVGERNAKFALDYLHTERIPVLARDVGDIYPRKVCMVPATGKVMVKRLAPDQREPLREREIAAATQPVAAGGTVDLF